ncbi:HEAT repeat domain-containing protein [Microcoleus sp. LEGE 07076]|uniref:HEAT repeat domain-containing protein n=1 Tax=Microcoleus sp. LEGE 07076 TaxID=915322 RepID=UPI001881E362|nr:HEAT repeat domain-containing protein [Microcoleus sp. LEGE 07076]MBE9187797.1 HEAT repeat domain-containing protein [Microcoleus sp. LEGE 07076]
MEISEIEAGLQSSDPQDRLRAIRALRKCDAAVALPMLLTKVDDPEFMVRSFVAMGLRQSQTAESFAALLKMMQFDRDPNVRAEAANSVSMFGTEAISHLVEAFRRDDNWLVRRSIMAPLYEMQCPEAILEICAIGLAGEDLPVQEVATDGLGLLANTEKEEEALQQLLPLVAADYWETRMRVARALRKFDNPQARAAVSYLAKDRDHRVVAATLNV